MNLSLALDGHNEKNIFTKIRVSKRKVRPLEKNKSRLEIETFSVNFSPIS